MSSERLQIKAFHIKNVALGKKVKIEENIAKPKQSIVELMREDLKEIDSGIDDIFVNELKDSITELENMNEEDFIKLKKTILDFDPVTE